MSDPYSELPQHRVANLVQKLLAERSVVRPVQPEETLRDAGLTSLDMVNLVLSVEAEFDLNIPEADITPANFRSITAISNLVAALLNGV